MADELLVDKVAAYERARDALVAFKAETGASLVESWNWHGPCAYIVCELRVDLGATAASKALSPHSVVPLALDSVLRCAQVALDLHRDGASVWAHVMPYGNVVSVDVTVTGPIEALPDYMRFDKLGRIERRAL